MNENEKSKVRFMYVRTYVPLAASQEIAFCTSAGVVAPACRYCTTTPVAWGQAMEVPGVKRVKWVWGRKGTQRGVRWE